MFSYARLLDNIKWLKRFLKNKKVESVVPNLSKKARKIRLYKEYKGESLLKGKERPKKWDEVAGDLVPWPTGIPISTPSFAQKIEKIKPTPTPMPNPTAYPGMQRSLDYFEKLRPKEMATASAYPVLADKDFMNRIKKQEETRQGMANLLLMQAFNESTLGRLSNNIFGVKPGGTSQNFASPSGALDYQVGPKVLGGGATPEMNILQREGPLKRNEIVDLYKSYNPEGVYLKKLLKVLFGL